MIDVSHVDPDGTVWFWEPSDQTGPFQMTPQQIQATPGLTEKVRAAVHGHVEAAGRPGPREPHEGPREATGERAKVHAAPPPPTSVGGHSPEWRWQLVQFEDESWWAIDNKPAVEAFDPIDGGVGPEFQRVVIPVEIVRVIGQS